jgi:hypothetical protein
LEEGREEEKRRREESDFTWEKKVDLMKSA